MSQATSAHSSRALGTHTLDAHIFPGFTGERPGGHILHNSTVVKQDLLPISGDLQDRKWQGLAGEVRGCIRRGWAWADPAGFPYALHLGGFLQPFFPLRAAQPY